MRTIVAMGLALAFGGLAQAQAPSPAPETASPARSVAIGLPLGLDTTGEPASVTEGKIDKGKPIVGIPVRHLYTGHVDKEIPGFLFTKAVAKGAPVFGIPMSSTKGGTQIVWCAPIPTDSRPGKEAWSTNCFVGEGEQTQLVMSGGLYPTMLSTGQALYAQPPQITQGPADFGVPLTLNYLFRKWDAAGDAEVTVEVRWPRRSAFIEIVTVERKGEGAVLDVLGGQILLTPTSDGRSATARLIRPLKLGTNAK